MINLEPESRNNTFKNGNGNCGNSVFFDVFRWENSSFSDQCELEKLKKNW